MRYTPLRLRCAWSVALVVLPACGLVGCGTHLYNAADEALARSASDAFKAADVDQFVQDERAVLQATNDRDLAATRRNMDAELDAAIVAMMSEKQTAQEVEKLITSFRDQLIHEKIPNAVYDIPSRLRQAQLARALYMAAVADVSPPVDPPSLPPTYGDESTANKIGGNALHLFHTYKRISLDYDAGQKDLASIGTGEIGRLNAAISDTTDLKAKVATAVAISKKSLDTAVKAFKDAVAAGDKTEQELADLIDRITQVIKRLEVDEGDLADAAKKIHAEDLLADLPLAKLEAAQAEVKAFLDAYAKAGAGQADASKDLSNAEAAGRAVAVLANQAVGLKQSSTKAKLVPLLFEQERLQIEVDRQNRRKDRAATRLSLLERQREDAIAEAMRLTAAIDSLKKSYGRDPAQTIEALLMDNNAKGDFVDALFLVSESIAMNRRRREEAEVALIGLDHDEALDSSEFALSLWEQTIAMPMAELLAYHGSGIKPEDVARFAQAAALVGVAVGVN